MNSRHFSEGHRVERGCDRREFLRRAGCGFGIVPFAHLLLGQHDNSPLATDGSQVRHHAPRIRNIIFLYMDGGPSQVDTFDYKPLLQRDSGKPFPMPTEPTQFNNKGNTLGSQWEFRQRGESGLFVSDLFPHLAGHCADMLCVVNSMVADFSEHTNANYFLHTGHGLQGRPSMGAWISYGLGSENQNLPSFVVLNGGLIPPGGVDCFHSGFLPAWSQGSLFRMRGEPLANVEARNQPDLQRRKLDLISALDQSTLAATHGADAIAAAIENQELAFRMQTEVPDLFDLQGESPLLQRLYGLESDYEHTRTFGRQCLIARRLVERGVRFVELTCPNTGHDRWDQHSNLKKGHEDNCRMVDQPVAALLQDLQARGLLDETLVVWGGEFGRTPFAQGTNGRDHNPFGYSMWLAGGGVRGGTCHGRTDDYGYKTVENPVTIHDLHATMLHLLGIDHERFTHRFGGRDLRLTDVYGRVLAEILDRRPA
jgi:hypothetical protein